MHPALELIPYSPDLAHYFSKINEEWITEMFVLEDSERAVLENPQKEIIDRGGYIFFVKAEPHGIVGTGALRKTGPGEYELTKMGVLKSARGLKAGEFILQALIAKAKDLRASYLYLLTNKKCEAAIHLYEKNGFSHDEETMDRFGRKYERANVAMRYTL